MMHAIVVIGASAGGLEPLLQIIAALPGTCTASLFVVVHIGCQPSHLPELLADAGYLPVGFAEDGASIEAGHIYVAPPDRHMLLERACIRLRDGPKVHFTRPAIDPLFVSAAEVFGERVVGIVLSGGGSDGATGMRAINEHGGTTLIQSPDEAAEPWMPRAALAVTAPDDCLPIERIARFIGSFCSGPQTPPHNFQHKPSNRRSRKA